MFPSTTWEWKRVKMARPPEARRAAPAKLARWWGRAPLNPRKPITLTVTLRGGAECWVEIHARGSAGRFHGATAIYDILREITNCG